MTAGWSAEELDRFGMADELEIAARRTDGTLQPWVPIWVVRVGEHVYVRTWYRRETGWFGHVTGSGRARVRVPGVEADVAVEDVGDGPAELRAGIDAAYRSKYGSASAAQMVTPEAAAATLRLSPEQAGRERLRRGGYRTAPRMADIITSNCPEAVAPLQFGDIGVGERDSRGRRHRMGLGHGGPGTRSDLAASAAVMLWSGH